MSAAAAVNPVVVSLPVATASASAGHSASEGQAVAAPNTDRLAPEFSMECCFDMSAQPYDGRVVTGSHLHHVTTVIGGSAGANSGSLLLDHRASLFPPLTTGSTIVNPDLLLSSNAVSHTAVPTADSSSCDENVGKPLPFIMTTASSSRDEYFSSITASPAVARFELDMSPAHRSSPSRTPNMSFGFISEQGEAAPADQQSFASPVRLDFEGDGTSLGEQQRPALTGGVASTGGAVVAPGRQPPSLSPTRKVISLTSYTAPSATLGVTSRNTRVNTKLVIGVLRFPSITASPLPSSSSSFTQPQQQQRCVIRLIRLPAGVGAEAVEALKLQVVQLIQATAHRCGICPSPSAATDVLREGSHTASKPRDTSPGDDFSQLPEDALKERLSGTMGSDDVDHNQVAQALLSTANSGGGGSEALLPASLRGATAEPDVVSLPPSSSSLQQSVPVSLPCLAVVPLSQKSMTSLALVYPYIPKGNIIDRYQEWCYLQRPSWVEREIVIRNIMRCCLLQLSQLHRRGLVHGSVKATNMFCWVDIKGELDRVSSNRCNSAAAAAAAAVAANDTVVVGGGKKDAKQSSFSVTAEWSEDVVLVDGTAHLLEELIKANCSASSGERVVTGGGNDSFLHVSDFDYVLPPECLLRNASLALKAAAADNTATPVAALSPTAAAAAAASKQRHMAFTMAETAPSPPLLTSAADLWNLGLVAIHLADGGFPPWLKRQSRPVPSLSKHHWSHKFESFVQVCVSLNPSNRTSAEALLSDPWFNSLIMSPSSSASPSSADGTVAARGNNIAFVPGANTAPAAVASGQQAIRRTSSSAAVMANKSETQRGGTGAPSQWSRPLRHLFEGTEDGRIFVPQKNYLHTFAEMHMACLMQLVVKRARSEPKPTVSAAHRVANTTTMTVDIASDIPVSVISGTAIPVKSVDTDMSEPSHERAPSPAGLGTTQQFTAGTVLQESPDDDDGENIFMASSGLDNTRVVTTAAKASGGRAMSTSSITDPSLVQFTAELHSRGRLEDDSNGEFDADFDPDEGPGGSMPHVDPNETWRGLETFWRASSKPPFLSAFLAAMESCRRDTLADFGYFISSPSHAEDEDILTFAGKELNAWQRKEVKLIDQRFSNVVQAFLDLYGDASICCEHWLSMMLQLMPKHPLTNDLVEPIREVLAATHAASNSSAGGGGTTTMSSEIGSRPGMPSVPSQQRAVAGLAIGNVRNDDPSSSRAVKAPSDTNSSKNTPRTDACPTDLNNYLFCKWYTITTFSTQER